MPRHIVLLLIHWGPLVLTDTPKSELGEHEGPLVLTEVLCQGEGWF